MSHVLEINNLILSYYYYNSMKNFDNKVSPQILDGFTAVVEKCPSGQLLIVDSKLFWNY